MIEKITLARPYAKAIFSIAHSTAAGDFNKWSKTLKVLAEISVNPTTQRLLRDSTVASETVATFFEEICPLCLSETEKNLLQLLASKRRLSLLPEISIVYEKLWDEEKQILPVELKSVIPLTETQEKEFSELLSKRFGKKIEIHHQVNPDLIGGYWIKAGDQVIDGSIRGHLEQLKATMGE